MMLRTYLLLSFLAIVSSHADFWISPTGDDAGPGSKAKPFATPVRAQRAVREARTKGGLTVWLQQGTYTLAESLRFGPEDSGTAEAPVVWRAAAGEDVWLSGGGAVPTSSFARPTDVAILALLPEEARSKVVAVNLAKLGITDWVRELPATYGAYKQPPPFVSVYCDGKRMQWARWPNKGFATFDEIVDPGSGIRDAEARRKNQLRAATFSYTGDRPKRWSVDRGVWMFGYWARAYISSVAQAGKIDPVTRQITTKAPLHYGLDTWGARRWYAFNLPEELDIPGEWYLDRVKGILYFWPPRPLAACRVMVTRVAGPLIHCQEAGNVTFQGLGIEGGRAEGILVEKGQNVRVKSCEIRNVSADAVRLRFGTGHQVVGCDIHHVGAGGVDMQGGDRKTLSPANFEAVNNHIHHTSEIKRNYAPPLRLQGVGIRAAHNLVHHIPHIAVLYGGNDLTMEYNEIYWVLTETSEAGVFYCGRNWTYRNNLIQYNYIHHINDQVKGSPTGCNVAHLDDCVSGNTYRGNVIFKTGRGISVCGGPWNVVENNLFIDCMLGVDMQTRGLSWWTWHRREDGTVYAIDTRTGREGCSLLSRLDRVPWDKKPYTKYPNMADLLTHDPVGAPRWCRITNNISINGPAMRVSREMKPEWAVIERNWDGPTDGDPGIIGPYAGDYRLAPNAPALAKTGFKPIPFAKIGLRNDGTRRSWPVKPEPPPKDWEPAWVIRREMERKMPTGLPIVTVRGTTAKIKIDGIVDAEEWRPGEAQTVAVNTVKPELLQWSATTGEKVGKPPVVWLQVDQEALCLAFENHVDPAKGIAGGRQWGKSDAVELALSVVAGNEPGPIVIWRGYTNGHTETSTEAGAPLPLVTAAMRGVQYGAKVVNQSLWTAELRIPFTAIGVEPEVLNPQILFALTVRRTNSDEWATWRKGAGHSWEVRRSGMLWLEPFGDMALVSPEPSRAYILTYGRAGEDPIMLKAVAGCNVATWSKPVGHCISATSPDLKAGTWQPFTFSFTPETDGTVQLKLMGRNKISAEGKHLPIWTHYDDIQIDGAEIVNGSFEDIGATGQPVGWKPDISTPLLVTDRNVAAAGIRSAKCWHNGRWKQTIKVRGGRTITVTCQVRGGATLGD